MRWRWAGLGILAAALLVGDQIRLKRPDHKYRLTIEIETPDGLKTASGVMAVHPDRGYSGTGSIGTTTKGDARAFNNAGQRISFRDLKTLSGGAAVTGELMPALVTFANLGDPATARSVRAAEFESAFGAGTRFRGISVTMVPNGVWPLDFGGMLGEGVTRGIGNKLPWLKGPNPGAAIALKAAGLATTADPTDAFTRQ